MKCYSSVLITVDQLGRVLHFFYLAISLRFSGEFIECKLRKLRISLGRNRTAHLRSFMNATSRYDVLYSAICNLRYARAINRATHVSRFVFSLQMLGDELDALNRTRHFRREPIADRHRCPGCRPVAATRPRCGDAFVKRLPSARQLAVLGVVTSRVRRRRDAVAATGSRHRQRRTLIDVLVERLMLIHVVRWIRRSPSCCDSDSRLCRRNGRRRSVELAVPRRRREGRRRRRRRGRYARPRGARRRSWSVAKLDPVHGTDNDLRGQVAVDDRSLHEQQTRQEDEERASDPRRHRVRRRRPEVDVQYDDGDDDGQRDEYHGEEQVLADERHDERRGWYDLGKQEEEDGQRQ